MAKEIDKIIQSKTAPKSNNVLWDDGENLKINRNGKWESVGTNSKDIENDDLEKNEVMMIPFTIFFKENPGDAEKAAKALQIMKHRADGYYDFGSVIIYHKGVLYDYRYYDWPDGNSYLCIVMPFVNYDFESGEANISYTIRPITFVEDDNGNIITDSISLLNPKILTCNASIK